MPSKSTTHMDNATYHKFKPSEMPEIRHLRSILLKSNKASDKSLRMDKIASAIVKDVDWKKLSVDINLIHPEFFDAVSDYLEIVNRSIIKAREQITEKLDIALYHFSSYLDESAEKVASSPELFEAANAMARKYHQRSSTIKKRHSRKPRKPKNNHNHPVSPPPEVNNNKSKAANPSPRPQLPVTSPPRSQPSATTSCPGKATNKTTRTVTKCATFHHQPASFTTTLENSPGYPESTTWTLQTRSRAASKSSNSSIKNHFKSTKSSKSKSNLHK